MDPTPTAPPSGEHGSAARIEILPVTGLPEFRPGDDLAAAIIAAAPWLRDGDVVVVTSDNPRSETPLAIIEEIVQGTGTDVEIDPDRASAIGLAIGRAQAGDVVVIAGKGHEQGQDVGGVVAPFDDREVARAVLGARGSTA